MPRFRSVRSSCFVRKKVLRDGRQRTEWVALRKGVAYLFRYREVSFQANARYLDALAAVDDPTQAMRNLPGLFSELRAEIDADRRPGRAMAAGLPRVVSPLEMPIEEIA